VPRTRRPDLELDEDPSFAAREWRFERAGWVVLALLGVAGLLGLLGPGPLSRGSAGTPEGLRVEYQRFAHQHAPSRLRVHVPPAARAGGRVRVWLDHGWTDAVEIEAVTPEPETVEVGGDRVTFAFRTADPDAPLRLTFDLQMQRAGIVRGAAGLPGGPTVRFRQVVYP
jgi:hypothetical protein